MTEETTFTELIQEYKNTDKDFTRYTSLNTIATQKIAELLGTKPRNTKIKPSQQVIEITLTENRSAYMTYTNLTKLTTYLNIHDLLIYTPSRDLLIIDYNQPEEDEEEETE